MNKPVLISSNKTSKQLVEEIYINNPNMPKKQLWSKAVDDLYKAGKQINLAIARTYVWCAEKKHAKIINPNVVLNTRNVDKSKLKKTKAYNLFESNPALDRKAMINLIEKSLNITNTSAQTHCSLSAKKFAQDNPSAKHNALVN